VGTGSFPGIKWPGHGDRPSPSSAEVKERVGLYLYLPSGPSWPVQGELYLYLYLKGPSANQTSMDSIKHPESDTCF